MGAWLLPRYVDYIVRRTRPGRLQTFLTGTAVSVRDAQRLSVRPDRRVLGAIGYLWFEIAVLFACFAAAGHVPPPGAGSAGLPDRLPLELHSGAGGIGVLDGSMSGMHVLYGADGTVATAATVVYHATPGASPAGPLI